MNGSGEFRRLHPLTPLLKGWKFLVALVVVIGQGAFRDVSLGVTGLVLVAALVVGVVSGAMSWWFTRYGIDGGDLRIDSGVFARRSRKVRLDRLQAVDVVRPLAARLLGVSELRLEVAGGGSTEAPLAYLSEAGAMQLRAELLARAAGLDASTPEAPDRPFVTVPFRALAGSALLSAAFLIGVLTLIGVTIGVVFTGQVSGLSFVLPVLIGTGAALYGQVVRSFGFTLSESPDGLRIRQGLLDTRAQTVPPGRIQGISIREPFMWRRAGWVRVDIDVAGYARRGPDEGPPPSTLLPVAPRTLAYQVVNRVLAEMTGAAGLDVAALEPELAPAPRRAAWLDPIGWRRLRYGADGHVFVTGQGVLTRVLTVVPHAKTQSVRLRQGPLERRLGLASVHVDTTPGPVDAVARSRDAGEARRIVEEQAVRARSARRADVPHRWMA